MDCSEGVLSSCDHEKKNKRLIAFDTDPLDYHSILDALKGCSGLFYCFDPPSDRPTYDVNVLPLFSMWSICLQSDSGFEIWDWSRISRSIGSDYPAYHQKVDVFPAVSYTLIFPISRWIGNNFVCFEYDDFKQRVEILFRSKKECIFLQPILLLVICTHFGSSLQVPISLCNHPKYIERGS